MTIIVGVCATSDMIIAGSYKPGSKLMSSLIYATAEHSAWLTGVTPVITVESSITSASPRLEPVHSLSVLHRRSSLWNILTLNLSLGLSQKDLGPFTYTTVFWEGEITRI